MTDQTPLLSDGLLGWPGFGPGGSQQWKAQRLYTGDIWYAPRSGFYLITGCGGGGSGRSVVSGYGGGSGATLINYPIYFPESAGGVVTIGVGAVTGGLGNDGLPGSATSVGDFLILGGGFGGTAASGLTGIISGKFSSITGVVPLSCGGNATAPNGGTSAPNSALLDADALNGFLLNKYYLSPSGTAYGAGSAQGGPSNSGKDGFLSIAWIGVL